MARVFKWIWQNEILVPSFKNDINRFFFKIREDAPPSPA